MRVLCVGNNTEDTDTKTRKLAANANIVCYGLLSELDGDIPALKNEGYYHTSVYDLEKSKLLDLARNFDHVIVLDQPKECYSHPTAFYNTVCIAEEISEFTAVTFLDPSYKHAIGFFKELVLKNKSFCIFPFIELLVNNEHTTVCCRSNTPITNIKDLKDFKTDTNYQSIRQKMLSGDPLPNHCSSCYKLENLGIDSPRIIETVEWANRLDLNNVNDLLDLNTPVYYEVRPSNKCNLQCRMCGPSSSHLIAKEYKKIGLISIIKPTKYEDFYFINTDQIKKLYVSGGEPSISKELHQFLDKCIDSNNTNFEFVINTNAVKFSQTFKNKISKFSNCQFIISIDGYNELNYYIRWPSNWDSIINNVQYLIDHKHYITFNVTITIYNIARLYQLLEFFDNKFPSIIVHAQLNSDQSTLFDPLNFPNKKLVINNLSKVRSLNCYKNDQSLQTIIDSLIQFYKESYVFDAEKFNKFLEFNTRLDASRNVKLIDYMPELLN